MRVTINLPDELVSWLQGENFPHGSEIERNILVALKNHRAYGNAMGKPDNRLYGYVTIELPLVVDEWFLQSTSIDDGVSYEDFLETIILDRFAEENPETTNK